jgi:hypothetical protein
MDNHDRLPVKLSNVWRVEDIHTSVMAFKNERRRSGVPRVWQTPRRPAGGTEPTI